MSTLYTTPHRTSEAPNGPVGPYRPKRTNRQALAFQAGETALGHTSHGVGLLMYYKQLVARAGYGTSSIATQPELAAHAGVTVQSIRRYDDRLVAAGLIWLQKEGISYRRYITAYEPVPAETSAPGAETSAPPEVIAVEPDPFFSSPQCEPIGSVNANRSVPLHPLTGSRVNQDVGLRPGGDMRPETIELLTAEKCHPATIRVLGHLDPVYVREQIDAAWRSGRGRDMPNFLIGCLKTGGVYGSSWSGGRQQTKDPPPEPVESWPSIAPLPTVCPTCGALCPASWHGHCPRCEPEVFDPMRGET